MENNVNLATNFSFILRVEGIYDVPCKSIKGIRKENEYEYIQEGGVNDYVHLRRKPISKPFTFQIERYVGTDYFDPFTLGVEFYLPMILFVNDSVVGFSPVRTFAFVGCCVIARDYGELNAETSGLLTETITIAYKELISIDT